MAKTDKHEDWRKYYQETGKRAPRETLMFALGRFENEPFDGPSRSAVDLGSGSGRDTIELLRRGWSVLAIDAEPTATEELIARDDLPKGAKLETRVSRFETAAWPKTHLVNSSFALPLCPPETFGNLWQRIRASLLPGGRVSCQLYGERDSWAGDPTITFLSESEVRELLADLTIEHFREEEDDSVTPRGTPKHWHIFHIVARNTE